MQNNKKQSIAIASSLLIIVVTLLSFVAPAGGDSFEIYLGKKLLLQQYLYKDAGLKTISLDKADNGKELDIYYKHCGAVGKGRAITIRDAQNRMIKNWQFADASNNKTAMSIAVKDITGNKKNVEGKMKLYYSSKELPGGRLLAGIVVQNETTAVR